MCNLSRTIVFMALFMAGGCVLVHAAQETTDRSLEDEVALAVMKYYSFAQCGPSSDTLIINFNLPLYDGVNKIYGFGRVNIWWPGIREHQVSKKDILERAVLPVLASNLPSSETMRIAELAKDAVISNLSGAYSLRLDLRADDIRVMRDRAIFDTYLRLRGIDIETYLLRRRGYDKEYQKKVDEIQKRKMDFLPDLIELQKVSFQNTKGNALIIDKIKALYPSLPKPYGIYLEYWDDPTIYDFNA